jgi:hypothetical protein
MELRIFLTDLILSFNFYGLVIYKLQTLEFID